MVKILGILVIVLFAFAAQAQNKPTAHAKQLKPQTTCPVMGDPVSKKLYVDHNGRRIYVCCTSCLAKVKKDPEKYISKLERMGQSVETIGDAAADTSAKAAETGYWTCPMHTEIHEAESGSCPICGMNLVFKKGDKDTVKTKNMGHGKMKM